MRKISLAFLRFLLPFIFNAAVIFYYVSVAELLKANPQILSLCWLFSAPAVFAEVFMSLYYDRKKISSARDQAVIVLRCLFFLALFALLVYLPLNHRSVLVSAQEIMIGLAYIMYTQSLFIVSAFAVLLPLYFFFVVRRKVLRLTFSFILPAIIFFSGFAFYYYPGSSSLQQLKRIENQGGVEIIFPAKYITEWAEKQESSDWGWGWKALKQWGRPRQLFVEGNKAYASYVSDDRYINRHPSLLELDTEKKGIKPIEEREIRSFAVDESRKIIYAGVWNGASILKIDKESFKILGKIDFSADACFDEELLAFYYDPGKDLIFAALNTSKKIIKHDLKTGKNVAAIDLWQQGFKRIGSIWNLRYAWHLNRLYAVIFNCDFSIIEIDPDEFKITRRIKLPGQAGDLGFDEANNTMFVSDLILPSLWQVDLNTLKVHRASNVPFGIRQIHTDLKSGIIFILSYLDGKLMAVRNGTGKIEKEIYVGSAPGGFFATEEYFYISSFAGVVRVRRGAF